MGKRRLPDPNQQAFAFAFEPPHTSELPAALAGLERQVCGSVGDILHQDARRREVIAAEMSLLLDETVSKQMLDAYASGAREDHKVPFSRFVALVQVCKRHDVLDGLLRPIGAAVLVGEEVLTAQIGNIDRQIELLREKRKRIAAVAPLIRGSTDS